MTESGYTASGETLSHPRLVPDGSADHLLEKVSIEADRLSGAVKDGVEAVQTAPKRHGDLSMEAYTETIRGSMQSCVTAGEHLLTLLRAKNPADAFILNVEFMQKSLLLAQDRFWTVMGMRQPPTGKNGRTKGRA